MVVMEKYNFDYRMNEASTDMLKQLSKGIISFLTKSFPIHGLLLWHNLIHNRFRLAL